MWSRATDHPAPPAPVYDLIARCIGARPLTPPGQAIQLAFAAGICILNDDPLVMQSLLSAARINAYQRGKAYLMVGLSDHDPLLKIVSTISILNTTAISTLSPGHLKPSVSWMNASLISKLPRYDTHQSWDQGWNQ